MGQPPAPTSQLQQVLNPLQAPGTNRRNYLVNGGFEIWQRGTGPFVTNGAYWADRWRADIAINTVTGIDLHRMASTISLGAGSGWAASIGINLGAGAMMRVGQQIMPGDTLDQLRGRVMTFSARVLPNTLNSIRPVVVGGVMGSTTNPFNTTNVAQTMWCTFTVPSNETSLYVGFEMANASSVSQVDEAMLVIGAVPADYFPEHPADEILRCQRYLYRESGAGGALHQPWVGFSQSLTSAFYPVRYPVVMPVTPTLTFSAIADWNVTNEQLSGTTPANLIQVNNGNNAHGLLQVGTAGNNGTTVGAPRGLSAANNNAWIQWEANP